MAKVFIEGRRNGYSPDQCKNTMTVGELIAYLEDFDEDAKVYLKNDNGYTYGSITRSSFEEDYEDDPEDEDTDAEDDYETMEPEEFLKKHIND